MKPPKLIKMAVMSLICGACSSAPVHYYTLLPPSPSPIEPASAECCSVQVRRVVIPSEVDRPELVTRSGADQAVLLNNAQWLAALRDEIRDALTRQIDLKLREGSASEPVAKVVAPIVFVTITRFDAMPAQYVLVSGTWRIQTADLPKSTALNCETSARIAIGSGVSAMVQGYQQAVAKIADRMALDILSIGRSAQPRCARY